MGICTDGAESVLAELLGSEPKSEQWLPAVPVVTGNFKAMCAQEIITVIINNASRS